MSTYIIAEAGVNHNGDIQLAKKLIDIAVEAKVDAVKFQTFKSEKVISISAPKAEYQINNTGNEESQLEMVKKFELQFEDFQQLKKYCEDKGIEFLSTPFDLESADYLLNDLQLKLIKIPSGEITNAPYLLKIAKKKVQIILSTGMASLGEIEDALGVIAFGLLDTNEQPNLSNFKRAYASVKGQQLLKQYVTLLHCTTEYPAPVDEVNLNAISTMKNAFQLSVGYSDHTEGILITTAAVALGATVIEKHITFDKLAEGPDHKASLELEELKSLVESIRLVEKAVGSGIKCASPSEYKNIAIARKSLVAKKNMYQGEVLNEENVDVKRPGNGISPMYYWDIQGARIPVDINIDEEIKLK